MGVEADKSSGKAGAVKEKSQEDTAPTPTISRTDIAIPKATNTEAAHVPMCTKDRDAEGRDITPPVEGALSHQKPDTSVVRQSEQPEQPAASLQDIPASSTFAEAPASDADTANRLNMRQLRTELPPAFVPHAEQQAPSSSTSSTFRHVPMPSSQTSGHMTHPSGNSIVFGANDSTASSPAPADFQRSQEQPSQLPQQYDVHPNMPPGLGCHLQESAAYAPPLQTNGTKTPPYNIRRDVNSAYYQPNYVSPQRPANFRYPPREPFTPAGSRPQANGVSHAQVSHTASPSSSTASAMLNQHQDAQFPATANGSSKFVKQTPTNQGTPTYDQLPGRQQQPQYVQHIQTTALPNDNFLQTENARKLRNHVALHYAHPQLSDCHIHISEEASGAHRYLDGHKIILSRSPTLANLVLAGQQLPASGAMKSPIHVALQSRFQTAEALKESVRFLYGGPLLQMPLAPPFEPGSHERVGTALQYLAVGAWLQVDQIAQRGMEITLALLFWDTLPDAVAYAFEQGISSFWQVQGGGDEDCNDSVKQPEWTEEPQSSIYQLQFQQRLLDWIIHYFPTDFYLDASREQMEALPRLPALPPTHQRENSQADPRLSKIRFGDMEVNSLARPHVGITTMSSLLLSFPFPVLKGLLEHWALAQRLGPETVASIMRSVTNEREARRKRALQTFLANPSLGHTARKNAVQTLYWEESVTVSELSRPRLVRKCKDVPTSEANTTSEQ